MPSRISAQLSGVKAMQNKMLRLQKRFPDALARGLYIETEVEAKEVKRRTPVDTGELRASEHVVGPLREGQTVFTLIVAGGPAAPYAVLVHEDPEAFHKVGQWKYLESVILESRPYMAARVAKRIGLERVMG